MSRINMSANKDTDTFIQIAEGSITMSISSIASAQTNSGYLINVLESTQQIQTDMMEKIISVNAEQTVAMQKSDIIGQVIDMYA